MEFGFENLPSEVKIEFLIGSVTDAKWWSRQLPWTSRDVLMWLEWSESFWNSKFDTNCSWCKVRMEDVEFDVTVVVFVFGSLMYDIYDVFESMVWIEKLLNSKLKFSLLWCFETSQERWILRKQVLKLFLCVWIDQQSPLFIGDGFGLAWIVLDEDASNCIISIGSNHYKDAF